LFFFLFIFFIFLLLSQKFVLCKLFAKQTTQKPSGESSKGIEKCVKEAAEPCDMFWQFFNRD